MPTPDVPVANDPPQDRREEGVPSARPEGDSGEPPADTSPVGPTPAVRRPVAQPSPGDVGQSLPAGPTRAGRPERDPTPRHPEGVLFAQQGPVLSVETSGPRTITIGKESAYRVSIDNSGEVAADDVVVYVQLPAWADVSGTEGSAGATQLPPDGEGALVWTVGRLDGRSRERLTLRLVPRQSRPFDLAVRWQYQPRLQQTQIEVQEPKLEAQLEGPREVHYGQRASYKLRLRNVGNGPAENVVLTLLPVGTGGNQPVSRRLGLLEAGAEKTIEVELTARQTEKIDVRVEVRADGGVECGLAEQILVRRAELQLAATAPKVRFVGTELTYELRIINSGNAAASNVRLTAAVPDGAKYLSGIEGGQPETDGNRISWLLPVLEPGAEERYQIQARMGRSGTNRLEFVAKADNVPAASAEALTRVEAMADLAMEVDDPRGPIPAGSEAVYKLRIRNRGTKAAENVEIVAYFSRGIEPVSAEGGTHRIGPGQVVFSPIPSLAAGAEMVLSVRARAEQPGNHVFRAEMHCKPLDTRLVREETTHFYEEEASMATAPEAAPVNTADRRAAAGGAVQPESPSQPPAEPRR